MLINKDLLVYFAREYLKSNLRYCTEQEQLLFKKMYVHGNLDKGLDQVVDTMPIARLSIAVQEVARIIEKKIKGLKYE